jgi:hypothetical protein
MKRKLMRGITLRPFIKRVLKSSIFIIKSMGSAPFLNENNIIFKPGVL